MSVCCQEKDEPLVERGVKRFAVIGNPNCGKTTLFNALTGLKQKVGNYPGVTVDRKSGSIKDPKTGERILLIDLPGLYSLTPRSPDEAVARDVLLGRIPEEPKPHGIINIVDASNLERNLYLTTQLMELGLPMLIVLTMTDVAKNGGRIVDEKALSKALGLPVTSVFVQKNIGIHEMTEKIARMPISPDTKHLPAYTLPPLVRSECLELRELVRVDQPEKTESQSYSEAITLLMAETLASDESRRYGQPVLSHITQDKARFDECGIDFATEVVEARYSWIEDVVVRSVKSTSTGENGSNPQKNSGSVLWTERLDKIVLHPIFGYIVFFGLMALIFQAVFTWAQAPMDLIGKGQEALANFVRHSMPNGLLRQLLVDGVINGAGTTVTFLPQIVILFLFLGILEDSGYLARAAFLMDKLMSKVGLHGKSFIPMLSSFACAIPGIMATRTINDRKSRIVTILIAPLMSCSARLPVYSMMIGAFIVARYRGLTMVLLYLFGVLSAFAMAWLFKKTLLRSAPPRFFIELPPYHLPDAKSVGAQILERSWAFLQRAGTIITMVSVVLWWLVSFPHNPSYTQQEQMTHSYAGIAGHAIEPLIKPIGFDWRIGVSLVSSFAAREVFVSSMGTIYSSGQNDESLKKSLQADPTFTPLLAVCIMVFYVLAMQCLSTLAVVRRETNSWKWPLFMLGYMTALAWIVTFIVWNVGSALHLGTQSPAAIVRTITAIPR
jgi:ferrous iron transport protein B